MSEQALLDTIHVELRQRRENGADYILLAPGNYGADYIRDFIGLDPKTAVLTSNFIGDSLEFCKEFGFHGALLIGHIGKLVKLAGGMWNTHSKFGDCRMEIIASHSAALGLRAERTEKILHCATCDDALRILDEEGLRMPSSCVWDSASARCSAIRAANSRAAQSYFRRNTVSSAKRKARRNCSNRSGRAERGTFCWRRKRRA